MGGGAPRPFGSPVADDHGNQAAAARPAERERGRAAWGQVGVGCRCPLVPLAQAGPIPAREPWRRFTRVRVPALSCSWRVRGRSEEPWTQESFEAPSVIFL